MFLTLKEVVDCLNAFRAITQADNYFGGREILKSENANIFLISDFMDDEFLNVANYLHSKKNVQAQNYFFLMKKIDNQMGSEHQLHKSSFKRCL